MPVQPVTDNGMQPPATGPSVWDGAAMARESEWIYTLTGNDLGELDEALERVQRNGDDLRAITRETFPLPVLSATLEALQREVIEAELHAGTIPTGVAEGMIENFNHQIRALRGVKTTELEIDPTELLRKVPFFSKTPEEDFEKVIARLKPRTIPADDYVIHEGHAGKSMFLIARGVIRVLKGKGEDEVVLASLLPGDFFGEMALLHDEKRSASCRAVTPCALYELTREDIKAIAEVAPAIQHALEEADAERTKMMKDNTTQRTDESSQE